jgi:hypothetical protein
VSKEFERMPCVASFPIRFSSRNRAFHRYRHRCGDRRRGASPCRLSPCPSPREEREKYARAMTTPRQLQPSPLASDRRRCSGPAGGRQKPAIRRAAVTGSRSLKHLSAAQPIPPLHKLPPCPRADLPSSGSPERGDRTDMALLSRPACLGDELCSTVRHRSEPRRGPP